MLMLTRREFLSRMIQGTVLVVSSPYLAWPLRGVRAEEGQRLSPPKGAVVTCCDVTAAVESQQSVDEQILLRAFEKSLTTLTAAGDVESAWNAVLPGLKSTDMVVLKINAIAAHKDGVYTLPEVVNAVVRSLAGVRFSGKKFPLEQVVILDKIRPGGKGVYEERLMRGPTFQSGLGSYTKKDPIKFKHPSFRQFYFCDAIRKARYIINMPCLKDHQPAITGALKNNFGCVIDHAQMHYWGLLIRSHQRRLGFVLEDDIVLALSVNGGKRQLVRIRKGIYREAQLARLICRQAQGLKSRWARGRGIQLTLATGEGYIETFADSDWDKLGVRPGKHYVSNLDQRIADFNNHPFIKQKTRLVVMDALFGCYRHGPIGPALKWKIFGDGNPCRLLVARDAVAMDSVCVDWINRERKKRDLKVMPHRQLHLAAGYGLGVHEDPPFKKIKLRKVTL
jgi:uncharacterized protein (DUF362 family)